MWVLALLLLVSAGRLQSARAAEAAAGFEPAGWLVWVSDGRKWVLGSSKATNVACLAVFDPDTNSALSRQLEIRIFVFKSTSASEWLICA